MTVIVDNLPERLSGLVILKGYDNPIRWMWLDYSNFQYYDIKRV